MNAADSVSKHVTNIIATNVRGTVSINSNDEKVRHKMDFHVLHAVVILLFIALTMKKWKIMN